MKNTCTSQNWSGLCSWAGTDSCQGHKIQGEKAPQYQNDNTRWWSLKQGGKGAKSLAGEGHEMGMLAPCWAGAALMESTPLKLCQKLKSIATAACIVLLWVSKEEEKNPELTPLAQFTSSFSFSGCTWKLLPTHDGQPDMYTQGCADTAHSRSRWERAGVAHMDFQTLQNFTNKIRVTKNF